VKKLAQIAMKFPNSKSVTMKIQTLHSCDFKATVANTSTAEQRNNICYRYFPQCSFLTFLVISH